MSSKPRSKKALYNGMVGLLCEIVTIICGLILPRLILSFFGSSYNGLTQSITQFLSFVVLLKAGVGAVTKAALYKSLAYDDKKQISRIIRATEIFMRRVALIFLAGLIVIAVIYPLLVSNEFEWFFTFTLVLIIGFSTLAQYYFGTTYQMLLEADQMQYVNSTISIVTTIANVVFASLLIKAGAGIHMVKLGSAIVFAANPIAINIVARKKYKIDSKVEPDNTALSQRWDAFAQQVAMLIRDNTDIVILTIVSNTLEVSVYTVYFMVIRAMNSIVRSFTNGLVAAFGNMMAKGEEVVLRKSLELYELMVNCLSAISYSCIFVLITPFVMVYTSGITDVDYNRPIFGYILALAYVFFCIRLPYQNIVEAAGHFKQTKNGAYIEAAINLSTSIVLAWRFGIIGVAVGTLLAMLFRTIQYALYVSKNLVVRSWWIFIKRVLVSLLNMALIVIVCNAIPRPYISDFLSWGINGVIVFSISIAVTFLINYSFYKSQMDSFIKKVISTLKH